MIEVRPATPDDLRFVHSSWFMTYWKQYAKGRISPMVYGEMDRIIDQIIARSTVLVTYLPEVPDEVLGYSVIEGDTVHAVYVKLPYREMGIGRGLVQGKAKWYSFETDTRGKAFFDAVGVKFNPFARYA